MFSRKEKTRFLDRQITKKIAIYFVGWFLFVTLHTDMNELITLINDAVWGYVLIAALVGCGVWFTVKTRFVQFRMVGEMFRLLTDSAVDTVGEQVKEVKNQKSAGEPQRKHISLL